MIEALLKTIGLKDEKRAGWELRNIEQPETVAGHSWGTALQVMVHAPEGLDREKAVKMALVHDIGEAEIGDIAHRAVDAKQELSSEEKQEKEEQAVKQISEALGDEIHEIWKEYEKRETQEAKFVKDMDMIDMCLTALQYEKQGRYDPEEDNENFQEYEGLDEFFATTEPRITTLKGQQLFREIKNRYEEAKE